MCVCVCGCGCGCVSFAQSARSLGDREHMHTRGCIGLYWRWFNTYSQLPPCHLAAPVLVAHGHAPPVGCVARGLRINLSTCTRARALCRPHQATLPSHTKQRRSRRTCVPSYSQEILGKGGVFVFIQVRQNFTKLIHIDFPVRVASLIELGDNFLRTRTHPSKQSAHASHAVQTPHWRCCSPSTLVSNRHWGKGGARVHR